MHDPWKPVDPLGEALHFLRMSGVFYSRSEITAPWALALPPFKGCMMFHVVTVGECWLEVEGADAHLLRPGELALVPHGDGHRLVSAAGVPAAALFDVPRELVSDRYEILRLGGGGVPTTAICGVIRFDHPAAHHLVRLLPTPISIDVWRLPEAEWLQSTLRFIAAEARELRAGGETVITRLAGAYSAGEGALVGVWSNGPKSRSKSKGSSGGARASSSFLGRRSSVQLCEIWYRADWMVWWMPRT